MRCGLDAEPTEFIIINALNKDNSDNKDNKYDKVVEPPIIQEIPMNEPSIEDELLQHALSEI